TSGADGGMFTMSNSPAAPHSLALDTATYCSRPDFGGDWTSGKDRLPERGESLPFGEHRARSSSLLGASDDVLARNRACKTARNAPTMPAVTRDPVAAALADHFAGNTNQAMLRCPSLVLYYSAYGHIEKMAEAVAEGARAVSGTQVTIKRVPELVPEEVAKKS